MKKRDLVVDLFGVVHVDRLPKVTDALAQVSRDADAIFLEHPDRSPGLGVWLSVCYAAVVRPAYLAGYTFVSLVFLPLFYLANREFESTEAVATGRVATDRSLPVHVVDVEWADEASDATHRWIWLNWGVVGALYWLDPLATISTLLAPLVGWVLASLCVRVDRTAVHLACVPLAFVPLALVGSAGHLSVLALLGAVAVFLVTVNLTIDDRNEHMLERVREVSDREGYDRVCLVTGLAHVDGMVRLADRLDLEIRRTYRPRWLRAPGRFETDPTPEAGTGSENDRSRRPQPNFDRPYRLVRIRLAAALVDGLLVILLWAPVAILVGVSAGLVGYAFTGPAAADRAIEIGVLLALVSWPFCYELGFEGLMGQTPGKRLLGLVAVRYDGRPCSVGALALRAIVRPLDVLVGWLVVIATDGERRIGDYLARTVVVRCE